jgi:AcrR family transcriptional regulator
MSSGSAFPHARGRASFERPAKTKLLSGLGSLPEDAELLLLQGFIPIQSKIVHGERKCSAIVIRARCEAVSAALLTGRTTPLRELAERTKVSERTLNRRFRHKDELYAFPPPEIASALAKSTVQSSSWAEVREALMQIMEALEANQSGRTLLLHLVELRRRSPHLEASDNHFAHELRQQLLCVPQEFQRQLGVWIGFFTDGFRDALTAWARTPEKPLSTVAGEIFKLLDPIIAASQGPEWIMWVTPSEKTRQV